MGIRETVFSRITTGSAGSHVGQRCYPEMLPENAILPAIRYVANISYDDRSYREYNNPTERAKIRVQVDCYADTSDECAALAEAVCVDFDGWTKGTAVGWSRIQSRMAMGWTNELTAYHEMVDVVLDHKR